jgi:hypothetical protein
MLISFYWETYIFWSLSVKVTPVFSMIFSTSDILFDLLTIPENCLFPMLPVISKSILYHRLNCLTMACNSRRLKRNHPSFQAIISSISALIILVFPCLKIACCPGFNRSFFSCGLCTLRLPLIRVV